MTATAGTPLFVWYLMRGSGLVALLLLSATLALGVLGVRRWSSPRWPRLVTANLHRSLSLLAVTFLGVHIATAVVDDWIGLRWFGVMVPFTSQYRPVWVGLGAVAFDLLVAVVATSLLRRRIGTRAWRLVHWATWILWPVALAHVLGSGTDAFAPLGLAVWLASTVVVVGAATWRLWLAVGRRGTSAPPQRSRPAPGDAPRPVPGAAPYPVVRPDRLA